MTRTIPLNVEILLADGMPDAVQALLLLAANDTDTLGIDSHPAPIDTVEDAVATLLMFDPDWLLHHSGVVVGWTAEPVRPVIEERTVYRFDIAPGALDSASRQAQLHAGQDVLVLGPAAGDMLWVEALDGAEFDAFPSELTDEATTPADRFAGYSR